MRRRWPVWGGVVDLDRAAVVRGAEETPLTPQEVALFCALAKAEGRVVGRDELLVDVWGFPKAVRTRAVDHAMSRLRQKVERDASAPEVLVGVRGVGYRYDPPADAVHGLIGRREAWRAVEAAVAAHAGCVVVGPAGIGKRALVKAWADACGGVVVSLDGASGEEAWSRLGQAFGVSLVAGMQPADQLALALQAAGVRGIGVSGADGAADALVALRARLGAALPIVAAAHGPSPALDLPTVALAPLSAAHGAAVIGARMAAVGAPVPPLHARVRWSEGVDGLPLALVWVADHASRVGVDGVDTWLAGPGLQGSLERAVSDTWRQLPEDLRTVLAAASFVQGAVRADALTAISGLNPHGVLDALDQLAARGLWTASHGAVAWVRAHARSAAVRAVRERFASWALETQKAPADLVHASGLLRATLPGKAREILARGVRASLYTPPARLEAAERLCDWAREDGSDDAEPWVLLAAVRTLGADRTGAEDALAMAREVDDSDPEIAVRQAWLDALHGRFDAAQEGLVAGLRAAERCGRPDVEAMARLRRGALAHLQGDARAALTELEAAAGVMRGLGDALGAQRASASAALMWLELGEPVQARTVLEAVLAADRDAGVIHALPQHYLNLGGIALAMGDTEEARVHLDACVSLARKLGDVHTEARARVSEGLTCLLEREPLRAIPVLSEARVALQARGLVVWEALAWAWMAVALHAQGRQDDAVAATSRAASVPVPQAAAHAIALVAAVVNGDPLPDPPRSALVDVAKRVLSACTPPCEDGAWTP